MPGPESCKRGPRTLASDQELIAGCLPSAYGQHACRPRVNSPTGPRWRRASDWTNSATRGQASALEHLQRHHPLVACTLPALSPRGIADRQRQVVPMQHRQAQIDLRAQAGAALSVRGFGWIGPQAGGEDRGARDSRCRSGEPADAKTTGGRFRSTIWRTKLRAAMASMPKPGIEPGSRYRRTTPSSTLLLPRRQRQPGVEAQQRLRHHLATGTADRQRAGGEHAPFRHPPPPANGAHRYSASRLRPPAGARTRRRHSAHRAACPAGCRSKTGS